MTSSLVFLKLGGSLITDKSNPDTPRIAVLERLAKEIRRALIDQPQLSLLIGHGSGSFGHTAALRYGTRDGAHTSEQWLGFAAVSAAAGKLNRLVEDALRAEGIPILNVRPSASAVCSDGTLTELATAPTSAALRNRLVPLVCGDVAIDTQRGATIVSTEDVFVHLASQLRPARILLAGADAGVLSHFPNGALVPRLTPALLASKQAQVQSAQAPDVTGGMAGKVTQMFALLHAHPEIRIHIFSGAAPDNTYNQLLGRELSGTLLSTSD